MVTLTESSDVKGSVKVVEQKLGKKWISDANKMINGTTLYYDKEQESDNYGI